MATFHLTDAQGAEYEVDAPDEHAAVAALTGGAPNTPGVLTDVAKSAASGLARGSVELAMSPATIPKLGADLAVEGIDRIGRKIAGAPLSGDDKARETAIREGGTFGGAIPRLGPDAVVDLIRGGMNGILPKPQTTPGKYAETIGEFAPAALGPGGVMRKAAQAVVPGAASEAAGEAATGTGYEPVARFLAGLLGNIGVTGVAAHASAPERMVVRATRGVDPQVFTDAQNLQNRGAGLGVPLSGPEAVQQITNGGTKLGDVQRVVEGSVRGGAATDAFYAQRPQQVADATGRTLDQIAPVGANPSTLGSRASEAASGVIDDVRQAINRTTRPYYRAAENHTLAPTDFDPIRADPAFQASLRRLRDDPVLGPTYAGMPDNSVAVIDAVSKDMAARGQALSNAANPGFQPQAAAAYTRGGAEARDIARDPARGGVQAYDDALAIQQQARRQNLEPLEQGPVGRVAEAGDTRGATDALLPQQPLTGSAGEVADAVTRLNARDPGVADSLVRQALADRADVALGRNQGGANQWGGAKVAKSWAGTPQQEDNLLAAIRASGRQTDMPDLLEVLRATGMRKAQGSATEFNRQMGADLSQVPLAATAGHAIATGGLSIPAALFHAKDALSRAWLGRNTDRLAELFLSPDSAARIGALAAHGAEDPVIQIIARNALQVPLHGRSR